MMEEKDTQYFKSLLIAKRKEMQSHMESITENEKETTIKDASGDHSAYAFHMADQGTDTMEREKNFFYAQRDGELIAHIQRALERIEKGEYGMCRACGQPIAFARLEAVPHATLCIQCKSKHEKISDDTVMDQGEDV